METYPEPDGTARSHVRFLRDDGHLSRALGRLAGGALPPLPPALTAALATAVLLAVGLGEVSGITLFAPVALLLPAAAASWHPHGGRLDRAVPPLLRGTEYLYLLALGIGAGVPGPLVFVLLTVVVLHHCDTVCRTHRGTGRSGRTARALLGWDGRMLLVAAGGALGWLPFTYGALAACLAVLLVRESAREWANTPVARPADVPRNERGGAQASTT
ncbi:hypothetical protein J0910_27220 [Nocardiopsis sp. CNT-189]|uniref:DUF5941 domain-containing protein n=1 Tax=Nocardiopsis oceanisediminis TaxID=2816862 RepID=UPI003B341E5A